MCYSSSCNLYFRLLWCHLLFDSTGWERQRWCRWTQGRSCESFINTDLDDSSAQHCTDFSQWYWLFIPIWCPYVCVCVRCRVVMVCLEGRAPEDLKDAQVRQAKLALLTPQGPWKGKRGREWVQLRPYLNYTNIIRTQVTSRLFSV